MNQSVRCAFFNLYCNNWSHKCDFIYNMDRQDSFVIYKILLTIENTVFSDEIFSHPVLHILSAFGEIFGGAIKGEEILSSEHNFNFG